MDNQKDPPLSIGDMPEIMEIGYVVEYLGVHRTKASILMKSKEFPSIKMERGIGCIERRSNSGLCRIWLLPNGREKKHLLTVLEQLGKPPE